jgi:hypothetical protein
MPRDLASHLLTLYNSPILLFPVSACSCFYSSYIPSTLRFCSSHTISFPPFSYLLYPCFIDWIANLHLQGTLSDFTPEEIYPFSSIVFTVLQTTPPMLSVHPFLWVTLVLIPSLLSISLWATSPPEWKWPHHTSLCFGYLILFTLLIVLSSFL